MALNMVHTSNAKKYLCASSQRWAGKRWKLLLFECVISKSFEKHESFGAFNTEISCVYAWQSLQFYLVKNSQRPIISANTNIGCILYALT